MKGHEWVMKFKLDELANFLKYWNSENRNTFYKSFEEFLHDSIIFDETSEGFEYWNEISKRVN